MYVFRSPIVSLGVILTVAFGLTAQQPATSRPLVVCYGDSITAGYGLQSGQAYPEALERDLNARGLHSKVINQGTSGATTKDAAAGVRGILLLHPTVVIVEFGGNDGLRGLPLTETRRNLDALLTAFDNAHIKTVLAGITLPPNYGPEYIHAFEQLYRELAAKHHTVFIPMLYRALIGQPDTIQPDGIHPTAKGSELIAHTLLTAISPLLRKGGR